MGVALWDDNDSIFAIFFASNSWQRHLNFVFRQPLTDVNEQHLAALTALLLKAHSVEQVARWTPVISCLAIQAASLLSPELLSESHSMDPRDYVKVHYSLLSLLGFSLLWTHAYVWIYPNRIMNSFGFATHLADRYRSFLQTRPGCHSISSQLAAQVKSHSILNSKNANIIDRSLAGVANIGIMC